jgi:hypothetical protein
MRTTVWALMGVLATACGDGTEPARAAATPTTASETVASEAATVREAEVVAPTAAAPAPGTVALLGTPAPIAGGFVRGLLGREDPPLLWITIADRPRPSTPPIGRLWDHAGSWIVRVIDELPSPYPVAYDVETGCELPVVGARRAHLTHDRDPRSTWTLLALSLQPRRGCDPGHAVVGAVPQPFFRIRDARFGPASAELTSWLAPIDGEASGGGGPSALEAVELPELGLTVARGTYPWVVPLRGRDVGRQSEHRSVLGVVDAGGRTFFLLDSPSDRWIAPIEETLRDVEHARCDVVDSTPLRVRRLPRANGEVLGELAVGASIEAQLGPSDWARVIGTTVGWAHRSGLRCVELPAFDL